MTEPIQKPTHNGGPLRIVLVGCVEEGRAGLQEILDWGGNVVGIFTFSDEIARKTSGAVSFEPIAERYGIPLYKGPSTNTPEAIALFRQLRPDVIFVIGWTRLVCREVLEIPRLGCIGMHASLLPAYRGRAPVNWVLIRNEKITGNTAMRLDEGADTGRIVAQKAIPIRLSDTCQTLYHKVGRAGREMLREILPQLARGHVPEQTQRHETATVMPKRRPEDGWIDWQKNALDLFNWVRALTHPYPGAFTFFRGEKVLIWEARIAHYPTLTTDVDEWTSQPPGTVLDVSDGIAVITGEQELITLHRLQLPHQPEMNWQEFVSRTALRPGNRFSPHPDFSVIR